MKTTRHQFRCLPLKRNPMNSYEAMSALYVQFAKKQITLAEYEKRVKAIEVIEATMQGLGIKNRAKEQKSIR